MPRSTCRAQSPAESRIEFTCISRLLGYFYIAVQSVVAGASTINVPDTVGYTLPHEYGALFSHLIANTVGADRVTWSTHCHNDLGLATANTLAAVVAGARQVEVTVNGIGERAGNTSLEEVVMTIATRPAMFPVRTTIDTTQITKSSRMVTSLTGMPVQVGVACRSPVCNHMYSRVRRY